MNPPFKKDKYISIICNYLKNSVSYRFQKHGVNILEVLLVFYRG